MTREATPIDLSTHPDLTQLIEEVKRTRQPQPIQEDGETVALIVPAGRSRRGTRRHRQLVDTSTLPPVPYRTVDEMLADRPLWTDRAFTDDEIKVALEEARVDAWHRKSS
jgi:antitoxin (DNA-binding transcriptional repressor) of toxin-antitoxin stability system